MKRKELAALPELGVTDEMRELAYGDTGRYRVEKYSRGERNYTVYNYRVYLRASVMEGILRIEIYEGDDIRNCNEEARYVVFLSRKENRYTTYIPGEKRWSRAKIDNLEYGHYNWKDRYLNHYWITGKEEEIILHYLGAEYGGIYRTVSRWQTEAAHREEIRGIDRVMDQVPEQPERFRKLGGRRSLLEASVSVLQQGKRRSLLYGLQKNDKDKNKIKT